MFSCRNYFNLAKNIYFMAIPNGRKSNRVFQAWTDLCHQIFGAEKITNHMLFREELSAVNREACFCKKKVFTHGIWYYEFESKRQPLKRKHTESLVKKNFRAQRLVKKIMPAVFWDLKLLMTADFIEKKNTTGNNASKEYLL